LYWKFGFLIYLLHQEISLNFFSFEVFLDKKFSSKAVFSSDVRSQQWKNYFIVSTNFLAQKAIGNKNIFSKFLFQEISLKREIFINFLPQKIVTLNMALFQHIL